MIAASGGSSSIQSAANEQYCPPNSPGAGNPQGGPGNNCGNPPDTCPDGSPKPPPGNCGKGPDSVGLPGGGNGNGNGNPQGPPETPPGQTKKKKKNARFHVKRQKAKRCYSRNFVLNVRVVNRAKGAKTTVARDGKRIKRTGRNKFTIKVNVKKLKRGVHTLTLRVKGADGKMRTRKVTFRRC